MNVRPFPLAWPLGRPRTPSRKRTSSRFKQVRFGAQRCELYAELERLGARSPVLSTNIELRRDGHPYASRRSPQDPGVAVYFLRRGRQFAIACDTYEGVAENLRAIVVTVEALRKIERHGSTGIADQAFSGFEALPPADWRRVLGVPSGCVDLDVVTSAYRRRTRETHPDTGGDPDVARAIQTAMADARRELLGS